MRTHIIPTKPKKSCFRLWINAFSCERHEKVTHFKILLGIWWHDSKAVEEVNRIYTF